MYDLSKSIELKNIITFNIDIILLEQNKVNKYLEEILNG